MTVENTCLDITYFCSKRKFQSNLEVSEALITSVTNRGKLVGLLCYI